MKLKQLNEREQKVIEAFRIHRPVGPYLDSGKFHGAGKKIVQSLIDKGIIEYSEKKYKYMLTKSGLKLLD